MLVAAGPPITVIVLLLAILCAGYAAALVVLWRLRVEGRWQRTARAVGLACLLLITACLVRATCAGAARVYLLHTDENLRTAQEEDAAMASVGALVMATWAAGLGMPCVGALAALVVLWRLRVPGCWPWTARALGLVCLLLVTVCLVYLICGCAGYGYMLHIDGKVRTAQTRAEVQRMTPLFRESPDSASWWIPPQAETHWTAKYSLFGLDGLTIHVEYDAQDRVLAVLETYE